MRLSIFTALLILMSCNSEAPEDRQTKLKVETSEIFTLPMLVENIKLQKRRGQPSFKKFTKALKVSAPSKTFPRKVPFKGPSKDFDPAVASSPKPLSAQHSAESSTSPDGVLKSLGKEVYPVKSEKDETPQRRITGQRGDPSKKEAKAKKSHEEENNHGSGTSSTILNGVKKTLETLSSENKGEQITGGEGSGNFPLWKPTSNE